MVGRTAPHSDSAWIGAVAADSIGALTMADVGKPERRVVRTEPEVPVVRPEPVKTPPVKVPEPEKVP